MMKFHGYTLIEIMITLAMIGIILAILSSIFIKTPKAQKVEPLMASCEDGIQYIHSPHGRRAATDQNGNVVRC